MTYMLTINNNYLKLQGNYLFSDIANKVKYYKKKNKVNIINLGIGDVTQPLVPEIIKSLHRAVDDMANIHTFKGYSPDNGYDFLRKKIINNEYKECNIKYDEIFISDGSKCDLGNIQEIFDLNNVIAICDPVYPVYIDSNVMAGRTGNYNIKTKKYDDIIYMPCKESNNFIPNIPKSTPDIIYLCFPNNPTGSVITKKELQKWVDYANYIGALIIYDSAYKSYIKEKSIPHSIYECKNSKYCAIECCSFSKNAGFTGMRLSYIIIPKKLKYNHISLHKLWSRRHKTKYNGTSYIIQKAGEAIYSKTGKKQIKTQINYYMNNAKLIYNSLKKAGYSVYGGINSPYIWLKTPNNINSWDFFDKLLKNANVVGVPGIGFGIYGEKYFRLSGFNTYKNTLKAITRIIKM